MTSDQHSNPDDFFDQQDHQEASGQAGPRPEHSGETTRIYTIPHSSRPVEPEQLKQQRKKRRHRTALKVWTVILVILVAVEVLALTAGIVLFNQMIADAPELNTDDFISQESTIIYDGDGEAITEVGVYYRQNITYDQCPESLIDAFLAVEDSRFFTHFGFDIPRFTKAAIENLKSHDFSQGGSTFTMQLVKNTYFSIDAGDNSVERTKSIEYKVQQIYLAIELEKQIGKKEIFQLYLNKLNFGGRIRGVQRAALYYFGKDVTELNLSESAMLAGLVNLPNGYNPYYHLEEATQRRNEVLYQLNSHGYITDAEYALAASINVEDQLIGETRTADSEQSKYQSYIDTVLDEAEALTGEDPTVRGMSIYTCMNRTVQEQIESIQNGEAETVIWPDDLMQVAMVAMNNQTGEIIGIGGGRNYDGARLLNRATMNYKQPGSAIKPVLSYALAYEYLGFSLDEILEDKPITYPMESMVLVNANGTYQGDVTIQDALGNSLNIPAILTLEKVVDRIGSQAVVSYLNSIGFSKVTNDNFHLSFAIGGTLFETTVVELAGAHSMLLNDGVYNEPHTISKLVMQDGTTYYPENQNIQAISSGSAWCVAQLLENNVSGPYYNYMQILERDYPVYAKTGTTDWGSDGLAYGIPQGQMKDKWMVASTSQYTNCVWVGYDMAVAGEQTYYTSYKSRLNIPGNIDKLLLDAEESISGYSPQAIEQPDDVVDVTYVYGSWPHVEPTDDMDRSTLITSQESAAGLENMPLITVEEYRSLLDTSFTGITASYDQYGNLHISWGNSSGICSGDTKDISLHDEWGNDIEAYGACLVDLTWLAGISNSYWATIYCDDIEVGAVTSETGSYDGWVADLYGTVKVCGAAGVEEQACSVAEYKAVEEIDYSNGWWDEAGVFHSY